jgi:hypothetical protein
VGAHCKLLPDAYFFLKVSVDVHSALDHPVFHLYLLAEAFCVIGLESFVLC